MGKTTRRDLSTHTIMSEVISYRPSKNNSDILKRIKRFAKAKGFNKNQAIEYLLEYALNDVEGIKQVSGKTDYINALLDQFYDAYEEIRGHEYLNKYSGIDRSNMGRLLKLYKLKNPEEDSKAVILGLRMFFIQCLNITENKWLHENMSVPIIYSKLNQITTILKNGKTDGSKTSQHELAKIIHDKFGNGQ